MTNAIAGGFTAYAAILCGVFAERVATRLNDRRMFWLFLAHSGALAAITYRLWCMP